MDIVVKNIDEDVRGRLVELARIHGHSVEDEVQGILRDAVLDKESPAPTTGEGFGSRFASHFSGQGIGLDANESIPEFRGHSARPVEFEP